MRPTRRTPVHFGRAKTAASDMDTAAPMKRRLATILVGDVVGYSAMMEADEEGTAARVMDLTAMVHKKVKAREGRVFKTMGDAVLADFASPLNALRCAVEICGARRTSG